MPISRAQPPSVNLFVGRGNNQPASRRQDANAVVQQHHLEILKTLPEDAVHPLPQKPCMVIVRDDYANRGHTVALKLSGRFLTVAIM